MADTIENRPILVKASDGETRKAILTICPGCKGEEFYVYTLEGDDHAHLQCINETCGNVFCHSQEHHDIPPKGLLQ